MREIEGDAWQIPCDVLCITTNGTVREDGRNIMGGGIARQAVETYPGIDLEYGNMIRHHGHHCFLIRDLVMFPTKDTIQTPATIKRILESIYDVKLLADVYRWRDILLPRPGSGLGGLSWHMQVRPAIERVLDDRFIIVSFPGEDG